NVGVDKAPLPCLEQRLNQHREDVAGEIEADEEGHGQRRQAPQETPPELDQMFEQRLLGIVDVLHGSGRLSIGGSSSVASGLAAGGISSGWPGSGYSAFAGWSFMMRSFSSRHFFSISSSSASRIIFSRPDVKWRAMPRILPTQ